MTLKKEGQVVNSFILMRDFNLDEFQSIEKKSN